MAVVKAFQSTVDEESDLAKIKFCLKNDKELSSHYRIVRVYGLVDFIDKYSKIHQLPDFYVKLFQALNECIQDGSSSKLLSKGIITKRVLQAMEASFYELSFGQMIELWSLFAETFTSFGNIYEELKENKGSLFFIAQVYSTFLLHTQLFDKCLPANANGKFKDLIAFSLNELKNFTLLNSEISDGDQYLDRSLLLLYSSFIHLKFEISSNEFSMMNHPELEKNPLDLSALCVVFEAGCVDSFASILKGDDKILSYFVIYLLWLNIKSLVVSAESKTSRKCLQQKLNFLITHGEEVQIYSAPWDYNVCTIEKANYGTAVWHIILNLMPVTLNLMASEDVMRIGKCIREISLQTNVSCEGSLNQRLLSKLKEDSYQNSKGLQSVIAASLWNVDTYLKNRKRSASEMDSDINYASILNQLSTFHRKWIKLSDTVPKICENEGLNPLWESLKLACDNLNQILQLEDVVKIKLKPDVYHILELVECLPLAYLLPVNQVRCITGLSVLFFMIPDTCNSEDAVKIAKRISLQIVDILDGVRSIWLFDFVSSGALLKQFVHTIDRISDLNPNESGEWSSMLLERFIFHIMKNVGPLTSCKDELSQIFDKSHATETSVTILLLVLKQINEILQKPYLKPTYKTEFDQISASACSCCVKLIKAVVTDPNHTLYRTLIECYMTVVEILFQPTCSIDSKKAKKYMQYLPQIIEFGKLNVLNQKCDHKLFFSFFSKICKCQNNIKAVLDIDDLTPDIWECFYHHISETYLSNTKTIIVSPESEFKFDNDEEELVKSLFLNLAEEEMNIIFQETLKRLASFDGDTQSKKALQVDLKLTEYIIESVLTKMKDRFPVMIIEKVIDLLLGVLGKTGHNPEDLTTIKIPLLNFGRFLVKLNSNKMPKDLLFHCLHFCMKVRLGDQTSNMPLFVRAFEAEWNLVHDIFVKHEAVVKAQPAVFISVTSNLLKAVVSASSQETFKTHNEAVQTQIVTCAQNMERLLTFISQQKTEFCKLVPYLVADYVDSVQHITVADKVKVHLISGVNRLLDICDENSLKTLSVNLNQSCYNIFVNMTKRHKQLQSR